jgi:protein phosphatase
MTLILRTAVVSDPGLIRDNNEDSVHAGQRLLAVADGMGGMPAGDVASEIMMRALVGLDEGPETAEPLAALHAAVEDGNRQIGEAAEADPAREGMGTTVTALLLSGEQFGLLHVGDSRAYLLRDGALSQLTKDDTFVQSLVDRGMLTPEEARSHPRRSLVTQAVQGHRLEPAYSTLDLLVGDRFLLCSDGLSDIITDETIAECLVTHADRQQCAEQLVKLALQAGAPDNVTVIIADIATG